MRLKAREVRTRAMLVGLAAVFLAMAAVFGLVALTLGLAVWLGVIPALLILCVLSLCGAAVMVALLASEARKARLIAARRAPLDRDLARAALMAAAPSGIGHVPRGLVGVGLVLLGAALVATRKAGKE